MPEKLSALRLRSLLEYSHGSGDFYWKVDRGSAYRGMRVVGENTDGYRHVKIDGVQYLCCRLAFLWMGEPVPPQVDHKNRVRNDDRWSNLIPSNNSLNQRNRGPNKNKLNGLPVGVFRNGNYYRAIFRGKHLGNFTTPEEASAKHARAIKEAE